jgi:tRNA(adenine34) deaminase
MKEALKLARIAYENDEVPVGAVIVYKDKIIARAHNTNNVNNNSLAHAEIKVINEACQYLKTKDLSMCCIYVTLEPCMMCYGAIINSRIRNVYFGAFDLNKGSIISNQFYKDDKSVNWHFGILEEECKEILKQYFSTKRGD